MNDETTGVSDEVWQRVKPLLGIREDQKRSRGRPPTDVRRVFDGVVYVLRTGCAWKEVAPTYGTGSTVHRYYLQWLRTGVFQQIWRTRIAEADDLAGIHWTWEPAHAVQVKSRADQGARRLWRPAVPCRCRPGSACLPGGCETASDE